MIVATAGAAALLLAAPAASALAVDRYVDSEGTGSAPCTNPSDPCMLIADAINVPSVPGDVIHVGGGGYGPITLPNGVSLIKDSFTSTVDTSGTATIGALGVTLPAITIASGTSPRTISGFTLRGGATVGQGSVYGNTGIDNLTVSGNTFDDASTNVPAQLVINSGSPRITGNTFTGTDDDQPRKAIVYDPPVTPESPEIDSNAITGFLTGIQVEGLSGDFATASIHDNAISGIYYDGGNLPHGIQMSNVNGTVVANRIQPAPGQSAGAGFDVANIAAASGTLKFSRNQIFGFAGVSQVSGATPVEFANDVFANNAAAISFFSVSSVSATGITATDSNGGLFYEIRVAGTPLTLNSSIVGTQGISNGGGGATCAISFSRGPVNGPPGPATDCLNDFQTSAAPMFVKPAANDFHLQPGSPMIDAGDPIDSPGGTLDMDGDPRALSSAGACSAGGPGRRDIGADEFIPALLDCLAPDTQITGRRKLRTRKRKARLSFALTSTEPGSSFECSVDSQSFAPCGSPFSIKLRVGKHLLTVRGRDAAGNVDARPATLGIKVKRKRPAP